MPDGYKRPATPDAVERHLRQEAGFGCARCGHPYIEFHHIVPFAEEQHFRTEDMVALCGNCHPAVSKFARDRQYEIKAKPFNIKRDLFKGALEYDKRDMLFKVGGNWFESCPVILQFQDIPIIKCEIQEGQVKVSLNLFDQFQKKVFSVEANDVTFRVSNVWDFEYKHNVAIVRYASRKIALSLDFRELEATIEGNIWLGTSPVKLGKEQMILPGAGTIRGSKMSNCPVGIQVGQDPTTAKTLRYRNVLNR